MLLPRMRRLVLISAVLALTALAPTSAWAANDIGAANWPFDDITGSNTTPDVSGNGLTGKVENATLVKDGRFGKALRFVDGDLDRVVVQNSPFLEPDQLTVSAWVRHLGSPGTNRTVV